MCITFRVNGVDYTHLTERRRLACLPDVLPKAPSNGNLNVRVTFNRRPVSDTWHHRLYFQKIASKTELARVGHQDMRVAGRRILHEYFDLLACLCLGHVLGDPAFAVAVLNKIKEKLDTGNDQAIFLACFKEAMVCNIFSLFHPGSPVHALLVDATVKYGTVADIEHLI